jgi:hypothetical protein
MQKDLTHRIGRHEKAPTRFELVYGDKADEEPHRREPATAGASELPEELQRVVERIARSEMSARRRGGGKR